MPKKGGKLLLLVTSAAVIILMGVCTSTSWISNNVGDIGLWEICRNYNKIGIRKKQCSEYNNHSNRSLNPYSLYNWLKATRGFAVISIVLAGIAFFSCLIGIFVDQIKGFMISIVLILSGVSMIIALTTFYKNNESVFHTRSNSYHRGYNCGWGGVALAICGSIVGLFAEQLDKSMKCY